MIKATRLTRNPGITRGESRPGRPLRGASAVNALFAARETNRLAEGAGYQDTLAVTISLNALLLKKKEEKRECHLAFGFLTHFWGCRGHRLGRPASGEVA